VGSGQLSVVTGFSGHWLLVTANLMVSPMEHAGYGTEGGVLAGLGEWSSKEAESGWCAMQDWCEKLLGGAGLPDQRIKRHGLGL